MPQSLSQLLVHIIYSTKGRIPFLRDNTLRDELCAYMAAVLDYYDSPVWSIGGYDDHIHALCNLSKSHALSKVIGECKRSTSKWLKTKGISDFYWQAGYGAFSVSYDAAPQVMKYIREQPQHHATMSFQDEFRAFLLGRRLDFEERYVWD